MHTQKRHINGEIITRASYRWWWGESCRRLPHSDVNQNNSLPFHEKIVNSPFKGNLAALIPVYGHRHQPRWRHPIRRWGPHFLLGFAPLESLPLFRFLMQQKQDGITWYQSSSFFLIIISKFLMDRRWLFLTQELLDFLWWMKMFLTIQVPLCLSLTQNTHT